MRQHPTAGGHELRGEADLADGHARFLLVFENIEDDHLGVVGSHLTGAEVWLNDCLVRDPGFADQLYQEARSQR
jgi:hypothetical protein